VLRWFIAGVFFLHRFIPVMRKSFCEVLKNKIKQQAFIHQVFSDIVCNIKLKAEAVRIFTTFIWKVSQQTNLGSGNVLGTLAFGSQNVPRTFPEG